jgi:WD40 repeat protein
MRQLRAATDAVHALGFSPDGRGLVVGHASAGLFAFELDAARPPVRLGMAGFAQYRDLYFDPDGRTAFWHTVNGRVAADRLTGRHAAPGLTLPRRLRWLAQTPDARRVFVAHGDVLPQLAAYRHDRSGWVREWEADPTHTFPESLALDPTGVRLAHLAERSDPTWPKYYLLTVRDAATGAVIAHGDYPYSARDCRLVFRPDGRQLVGLHNMTLLVWEVPNWGKPRSIQNDTRKHLTAAAFDPSGRHLYTTSNDAAVVVWDTTTWDRVRRYTWEVGPLKAVAVSPDGALAAVGSDDGRVVVWDVE